jgi:hypothetical protein
MLQCKNGWVLAQGTKPRPIHPCRDMGCVRACHDGTRGRGIRAVAFGTRTPADRSIVPRLRAYLESRSAATYCSNLGGKSTLRHLEAVYAIEASIENGRQESTSTAFARTSREVLAFARGEFGPAMCLALAEWYRHERRFADLRSDSASRRGQCRPHRYPRIGGQVLGRVRPAVNDLHRPIP